MVRAKFTCTSVEKSKHWREPGFNYKANFTPVTSGSKENEEFYKWTPSGSVTLQTYKEDHFEPGIEYYIDFIKVE